MSSGDGGDPCNSAAPPAASCVPPAAVDPWKMDENDHWFMVNIGSLMMLTV